VRLDPITLNFLSVSIDCVKRRFTINYPSLRQILLVRTSTSVFKLRLPNFSARETQFSNTHKLKSDDHSVSVPPLPIPNRTVKRNRADDSVVRPCESRSSSDYPLKTPVSYLEPGVLLWAARTFNRLFPLALPLLAADYYFTAASVRHTFFPGYCAFLCVRR